MKAVYKDGIWLDPTVLMEAGPLQPRRDSMCEETCLAWIICTLVQEIKHTQNSGLALKRAWQRCVELREIIRKNALVKRGSTDTQ